MLPRPLEREGADFAPQALLRERRDLELAAGSLALCFGSSPATAANLPLATSPSRNRRAISGLLSLATAASYTAAWAAVKPATAANLPLATSEVTQKSLKTTSAGATRASL